MTMKLRQINSLNQCPRDGRIIVSYCAKQTNVRRGKGDHDVVVTNLGSCAVPTRPLGYGLYLKIIATLAAIGITGFTLWWYWYPINDFLTGLP